MTLDPGVLGSISIGDPLGALHYINICCLVIKYPISLFPCIEDLAAEPSPYPGYKVAHTNRYIFTQSVSDGLF